MFGESFKMYLILPFTLHAECVAGLDLVSINLRRLVTVRSSLRNTPCSCWLPVRTLLLCLNTQCLKMREDSRIIIFGTSLFLAGSVWPYSISCQQSGTALMSPLRTASSSIGFSTRRYTSEHVLMAHLDTWLDIGSPAIRREFILPRCSSPFTASLRSVKRFSCDWTLVEIESNFSVSTVSFELMESMDFCRTDRTSRTGSAGVCFGGMSDGKCGREVRQGGAARGAEGTCGREVRQGSASGKCNREVRQGSAARRL